MSTFYSPELLYLDGAFVADRGIVVDESGVIECVISKQESAGIKTIDMPRRALVPGFVNAHSHAFQRLIRGKSESSVVSGKDFWSWRCTMYYAAGKLTPQGMYDVARMAFLEMLFAGITTVGEFHYVHADPDGRTYDDPNLLSKQVIAAARSVGVRIVLLRTAYLRSGYGLPRDAGQTRFFESTSEFLRNMDDLTGEYKSTPHDVKFGIAPHSLRAVPLEDLLEITDWARAKSLPMHMHVSEQIAENQACIREYGRTPVDLLHHNCILGDDFTAVHAIHIEPEEIMMLAQAGSTICSCPTTERNLGDGIFAADLVMRAGVPVALGSDSQAQIDPLEDARELEYHLRLRDERRAILDGIGDDGLAGRLLTCATSHGARSLRVAAGVFTPGASADAVAVDLDDLSIAGYLPEDLPAALVFSMNRTAIRDVLVQGRWAICDRKHPLEEEIVARYREVHKEVWGRGAC